MELHAGSNLFSVALVASLLCVFTVALVHYSHAYSERNNMFDCFELAIDTAEHLREQVLSSTDGRLGLVEISQDRVENYIKVLKLNGIGLRVEIVSLGGEPLLAAGPYLGQLGGYLSSSYGASFPVPVVCENGATRLCELSVQVWRY